MRRSLTVSIIAMSVAVPISLGQTTINVDSGETLTQQNLEDGSFNGDTFALDPSTTFSVNSGGVIGPLGGLYSSPGGVFDLVGATIDINSGGMLANDNTRTTPIRSTIGDGIVNLYDGGVIDRSTKFDAGSTVNIFGGLVSFLAPIYAQNGSVINVFGGTNDGFYVDSGATVNVQGGSPQSGNSSNIGSGGTINLSAGGLGGVGISSGGTLNFSGGKILNRIFANTGSLFNITGGEFTLNGASVSSLAGGLPANGVLTGTLADGSVFVISASDFNNGSTGGDYLAAGSTTLNSTSLPTADLTPQFVSTGAGPDKGLRPGQSLTLSGDATLADGFSAVSATLNIDGGTIGRYMTVANSNVSISGGTIGDNFQAVGASTVEITGGSIGNSFSSDASSQVDISGGSIYDFQTLGQASVSGGNITNLETGGSAVVDVSAGSQVGTLRINSSSTANISGGTIGAISLSSNHGVVNLSGGRVGQFSANSGQLNVFGNEFELNGASITSLSSLPSGSVLTATLQDGSVLILDSDDRDRIAGLHLNPVTLPTADPTPMSVSTGDVPLMGLRAGQTLTMSGDSHIGDNFGAVSATLNLDGGTIGSNFEAAFSNVTITGGEIGDQMGAFSGTTVDISGGTIGENFTAFSGSTVNWSGGQIGRVFHANAGSHVNVIGGEFFTGTRVFTGTLADGSVFILSSEVGDSVPSTVSTLTTTTLPTADLTPQVISTGTGPETGLRPGQNLTVTGSATLGDRFNAVGSILTIDGTQVGDKLEVAYTQVTINGGTVGNDAYILEGSNLHMTSGSIGDGFHAFSGTTVQIDDGTIGQNAVVDRGATMTVSGGQIGYGSTNPFDYLEASFNSTLNIDGGLFGRVDSNGIVNITGGTLSGGVNAGGASTFNISGGLIDSTFSSYAQSVVNLSGGVIGDFMNASGVVNITGGSIGDHFTGYATSSIDLSGGSIGDFFSTKGDIAISGGSVGGSFTADDGSHVDLYVRRLYIDGVLVPIGNRGDVIEITQRGGAHLSAMLLDGSIIDFTLNDVIMSGQDYFSDSAVLTVSNVVPEASSMLMLSVAGLFAGGIIGRRRMRTQRSVA